MGQNSTLKAFVVKKKKVLLPTLETGILGKTAWCGAKRKAIDKTILIEEHEAAVNGYSLYGTDIPVIFCYPQYLEMTDPILETCIGVESRQWEVSKSMRRNYPNRPFQYNGKIITDEEVLEWLENEKNIESMKKVKDFIENYGEQCIKVVHELNQRKLEEEKICKMVSEVIDATYKARTENLVERNSELIKKYNI